MLWARSRAAIEEAGDLAERQHGFREGHFTIGAIRIVIQTTQEVWRGNHRSRESCVLVTLDVRDAFNLTRWVDILDRFPGVGQIDMVRGRCRCAHTC